MLQPAAAAPRESELTARALASGLLVGALLCVANLYMGLKTGIWDSGHVTASILAFALLSGRLTRLENNLAQTAACAAGAVPAAAGLLGAVPALQLLGRAVPAWGIAAWGLSLGVLGILFGAALRHRLLDEEKLPFPSGVAAAEVIEALHAGGAAARGRTRALLGGGAIAAFLGWFRDGKPALIPGSFSLPVRIGGVPLDTLGVGLSTSPLLWGVGMVVGPHIAFSMLAGSVLGWLVLGPWLLRGPLHLAADHDVIASWLSWPGTALLVGAAAVALLQQAGALKGALRDMRSVAADRAQLRLRALGLGVAAAIVVVAVGSIVFGLRPLHAVIALLCSVLGASICARSAGLTDITPTGSVGQLTQAAYGPFAPGQPAMNVAAGSVVAGDATHAPVLLWSLRSAQVFGAKMQAQVLAAVAGCAVGAFLCVPAYDVLVRAYGLGSARLPTPTGVQWKAMGEVAARGLAALPPGTLPAVAVACAAGIALAALGATRAGRVLPSAFAVGIGMLVPFDFTVAIACGAVLLTVATRANPQSWSERGAALGGGLIAGESLIGVVAALLTSLGLL